MAEPARDGAERQVRPPTHVEVAVRQLNGELAEDVLEAESVDGTDEAIVEVRSVPSAPRRSQPDEPLPGSLEHDRTHPSGG